MDVFVYAPEQFENLCVLARTLEVLGFATCHVYDPHRIVRERYGKSYSQKPRRGATSLHHFRFRASDLLLIGSEGHGLDASILELCQAHITIPQAGVTESLNVAVASGIVLAEWKRQEALGLLEAPDAPPAG